ncbi:hypothetical protein [Rhizobium miluonense]|uniref:hypothetical protein n=1 Tax=Rhizobium miluonense TaxID=411945 RepID=UPI0011119406|nr:hypothetical protein [Rhizobium miluonense]
MAMTFSLNASWVLRDDKKRHALRKPQDSGACMDGVKGPGNARAEKYGRRNQPPQTGANTLWSLENVSY